jgi:hypothetical protein
MRFVILHYHILKNAGSTVWTFLSQSFGDRFAEIDKPDRDGRIQQAELLQFLHRNPLVRAVSSHQLEYPVPEAAGFAFFDLCFLRDPIDRLRSVYDYFREKPLPSDPISQLANRWGMSDFFAAVIDDYPWYVNDVQVNLLANGVVNRPATRLDLDRAANRALRAVFLGVVDCYKESIAVGQRRLRPLFPELNCDAGAVNVSASAVGSTIEDRARRMRESCAPAVFDELLRLNRLDCELVSRARVEIARRLKSLPPEDAA